MNIITFSNLNILFSVTNVFLVAKARISCQGNLCGICGERIGSATRLTASTSVPLYQLHSNNIPYQFLLTSGRWEENWPVRSRTSRYNIFQHPRRTKTGTSYSKARGVPLKNVYKFCQNKLQRMENIYMCTANNLIISSSIRGPTT